MTILVLESGGSYYFIVSVNVQSFCYWTLHSILTRLRVTNACSLHSSFYVLIMVFNSKSKILLLCMHL